MRRLIAFRWRGMAAIYAQSALCALATAAPLALAYALWTTPAQIGFAGLTLAALAGCLCWAAMLFVVRHPARGEFVDMAGMALAKLRRSEPAAS